MDNVVVGQTTASKLILTQPELWQGRKHDSELFATKIWGADIGSVWIRLILLKLKTYCWNHCSKIIFKCINSTVGPIFNEKVAKKWNLWVYEQYIITVYGRKVNICGYCSVNSTWTVTAFYQNAWMKKKKKKKRGKTQTWEENVDPNIHILYFYLALLCVGRVVCNLTLYCTYDISYIFTNIID